MMFNKKSEKISDALNRLVSCFFLLSFAANLNADEQRPPGTGAEPIVNSQQKVALHYKGVLLDQSRPLVAEEQARVDFSGQQHFSQLRVSEGQTSADSTTESRQKGRYP